MGEILSFGSSSKFKTDLGGNMRIIIVGGIAAGMSAAAVISPMLITFLGMEQKGWW